jgi:hypothetical protein
MRAAKRNKILAKWAGGRLGYTRDALDKYVRSVIFSHLVSRNDERIIATILSDFEKEGIHITEETIRRKIQSIETRIKHRAKSKDVD